MSIFLVLTSGFALSDSDDQYIYKWKDSEGMVHYTERRPEPGIEYEKVRRPSNKASSSVPVNKVEEKIEESTDKKDDRYTAWRKENCRIATENLDVLQNASRIAQDDGQGGTRLMTDEEKAAQIKQMQEQIQKFCTKKTDEQ
ncbi:DUF4124 domain-containing protein [Aliikangiella maris]|uniref:DUF4124 domain-containing protein n=2 Tax=Aliikangiella maris TaxID=3162458 RepID=A0ABV3MRP3_9GAMM